MATHTGSRCNSSTSTTRRARPLVSSAVAPRRPSPTKPTNNVAGDSKARTRRRDMEVRRKMEALRRLLPSGDGDGDGDEVDELLLRAAGYIARLQAQVTVMQLMVDVLEHA